MASSDHDDSEQEHLPAETGVTGQESAGYTGTPPGGASQDPWAGLGAGWAVTSTMSAAVLVCGGLGWLIDLIVGTTKVFLPVGMVGGAAAGTYLVYIKYGKGKSAKG